MLGFLYLLLIAIPLALCGWAFAMALRGTLEAERPAPVRAPKPAAPPAGAVQLELNAPSRLRPHPPAPVDPALLVPPPVLTGTRDCPACGEEIRAAARICRFCRSRLDLAPLRQTG